MSLTPGITSSFSGYWTGVMAVAYTDFVLKVIVSLTCIALGIIFSLPVIFSKMLDFICVFKLSVVRTRRSSSKSEKKKIMKGLKCSDKRLTIYKSGD